MCKTGLFLFFIFLFFENNAQLVEVQYNYDNVGNCIFGAQNNAKTPLFLNLSFTSIENTVFSEPLPYIKKVDPGFNSLFMLQRDYEADAPRFIFEIKTYRSDPFANVNLDFPYLVPFAPGTTVKPADVDNIDGFWGASEPKSWKATGFNATPGEPVYAARQGQIVEITSSTRGGDPQSWYHTWTNAITLLQSDGSLITYKNVVDKNQKLELNQKIVAGQMLGEVAPNSNQIILLVYHNILGSADFLFIIPQFVTSPGKIEIVNSALNIGVVHPIEVRGLEMTKKEQKKLLK